MQQAEQTYLFKVILVEKLAILKKKRLGNANMMLLFYKPIRPNFLVNIESFVICFIIKDISSSLATEK